MATTKYLTRSEMIHPFGLVESWRFRGRSDAALDFMAKLRETDQVYYIIYIIYSVILLSIVCVYC